MIIVNTKLHEVKNDGKEVAVPRAEYELLKLLASRPGEVFTREELSGGTFNCGRNIDQHIARLRRRMKNKSFIRTIQGYGYSSKAIKVV